MKMDLNSGKSLTTLCSFSYNSDSLIDDLINHSVYLIIRGDSIG